MATRKKTYWISKGALTVKGEIHQQELVSIGTDYVRNTDSWYNPALKIGRDAHETCEQAVAAAEKARDRKLASLQKQMDVLRAKVFA